MSSSISLIDQDDAHLYLSGPGTPYSGSGTPWTAQATSPYQLSLNDVTGSIYTPQAPTPAPILAGGPPLALGSELVGLGYGDVEEAVGVQCYATTHDHAVALAHRLRTVLAQTRRPPILAVRPHGATGTVYWELRHSRLQETMHFLNQEAAASPQIVRLMGTWSRSPLGGRLTGETLVNAASMGNAGSGSPSNLVSLGTSGGGELALAGSPLNLTMTPQDGAGNGQWLLATVSERTLTSRSDSLVTASTSGGTAASVDLTFTAIVAAGTRPRILLRVTSPSANLELRILALDSAAGSTTVLYRSPWVAPSGSGSSHLLDMGGWHHRLGDADLATITHRIRVEMRSTNGSNTSGTLAGVELLGCHTFCLLGGVAGPTTPSYQTRLLGFRPRSGRPALPMAPLGLSQTAAGVLINRREVRGRPPVYVRGASLWAVTLEGSTGTAWGPTTTYTLTATHAPLYHTLRGNG